MTKELIIDLFFKFLNNENIPQQDYLSLMERNEFQTLKEALTELYSESSRKDLITLPIISIMYKSYHGDLYAKGLKMKWISFFNDETRNEKMELIHLFLRFLHEKKLKRTYKKAIHYTNNYFNVIGYMEHISIESYANTFMMPRLYPFNKKNEVENMYEEWVNFAKIHGCDIF